MAAHPLTPLLAPRSIALVGASQQPNSPGNDMIRTLRRSGFDGSTYAVNPKYDEVAGYPCYPDLDRLPQPVDLAVLSVSNGRLEAALEHAAGARAGAAVIFASGEGHSEGGSRLVERLRAIAGSAAMPVCGVNCMGFYNDEARVWVCGFPSNREPRAGGITFIAQSGSVFGALAHNDPRFRFNFAVSSGQELVTTLADYIDYALERESTRVIGVFAETIRDPEGFMAALAKAKRRAVPVVILKVGRTPESQAMAVSHTGALTGDSDAFDAVCRRHGAIRVHDMDEMAATLLLLNARRVEAGGLATIHDSGGERELLVDLAKDVGVAFARLSPDTRRRLADRLEPGLEAENPLDAWGTGNGFEGIFTDCLRALADDPDTAISMLVADIRDGYYVSEGFVAACETVARENGKPIALATNFSGVRHDELVARLDGAGIPVLDGTRPALQAVRHALTFRDEAARAGDPPPSGPGRDVRDAWRQHLAGRGTLEEAEALELLADYGMRTPAGKIINNAEGLERAAATLSPPFVLKTAAPGIRHKSDVGGVRVGLSDKAALHDAYAAMSATLGPRALVQQMVPRGVELVLGMKRDPQFGPIVMIGAGGVLAELTVEIAHEVAPFGPGLARERLAAMRVGRLVTGHRGQKGGDLERVARAVASFSVLAADFGDLVSEIDVNPLIVTPEGEVAVDCLIETTGNSGDPDGS